MPLHDLNIA